MKIFLAVLRLHDFKKTQSKHLKDLKAQDNVPFVRREFNLNSNMLQKKIEMNFFEEFI